MELTVVRRPSQLGCTIGELLIDGEHECWTLEDEIREVEGEPVEEWKIQNETAIPSGRYQVVIDYSSHFAKDLPHVLDVPGFTGIRIHAGNTAADTEGCLLVGANLSESVSMILNSNQALNALIPKLQSALAEGEVWITYQNPVAESVT